MSFEFDDDDEDDEVAHARFDRLVELLDVVRANTKEINKIAEDIREDTRRRIETNRRAIAAGPRIKAMNCDVESSPPRTKPRSASPRKNARIRLVVNDCRATSHEHNTDLRSLHTRRR